MLVQVTYSTAALSYEQYCEMLSEVENYFSGLPRNRIFHVCSGENGKLHITEVWDSEEAYKEYRNILLSITDYATINDIYEEVLPIKNLILHRINLENLVSTNMDVKL